MIPVNVTPWEPDLWRQALKSAYRSSTALLAAIGTEHPHSCEPGKAVASDFPVLVPQVFAQRMRRGDPDDPLLRQVLAVSDENQTRPGFVVDPLHETDVDAGFSQAPGLIQKYRGRVLLITTGGCAVHCRYCFRRHFPYQQHRDHNLDQALTAISADSSISEIILSGGDPLILDDGALAQLFTRIAAIPHIQRLRVHSRLPIVLPQRITQGLLNLVRDCHQQVTFVVHCNHPRELSDDTARAFACLKQAGAWLFNQAVLLNGVNQQAATQVELAEKLFAQQVLPYYLHLPDPVAGTHHFYVSREQGQAVYREMQARLPGYLLPKLVQEVPKKASKMIVSSP